jgi:hypothetical protein
MAVDIKLPGFDDTSPVRQNSAIRQLAEQLANYAPLASPLLTGDPKAPTPVTADNDTSIATTAFVKAQAYAPLASPALTGAPTSPTQTQADNSTKIATTAYVDTLGATKAPLASPAFTGNPIAPTQTAGDNSTRLATTAYADTAVALKAPLASPVLTGVPIAPTAAASTNTTQIATTAFVQAAAAKRVTKSTNQTVASTTAFVNDTELNFPMVANGKYAFRIVTTVYTGGGGIVFAVNGPSGMVYLRASYPLYPYQTAYNTTISGAITAGTNVAVEIVGTVTNGTTAGNFTVRYAQSTSSATALAVEPGSWLEYTVIA